MATTNAGDHSARGLHDADHGHSHDDHADGHGHDHDHDRAAGDHPHADDHGHAHGEDHGHEHSDDHGHDHHGGPLGWLAELFGGHSHGAPTAVEELEGSAEGIRAVKISLVGLF